MKPIVRKFFFLASLLCFVAILSAFVATAGNHRFAEENNQSELSEIEECEALREKEERRNSRKDEPRSLCQTTIKTSSSPLFLNVNRLEQCSTERNNLNGFGGFLLT